MLGVGERSIVGRSLVAKRDRRNGSDYAGISSDNLGEKPGHRKPKGSWGRLIRPGLVGALAEAERRR